MHRSRYNLTPPCRLGKGGVCKSLIKVQVTFFVLRTQGRCLILIPHPSAHGMTCRWTGKGEGVFPHRLFDVPAISILLINSPMIFSPEHFSLFLTGPLSTFHRTKTVFMWSFAIWFVFNRVKDAF